MIVVSGKPTCVSARRLAKALDVPYYNLSKVAMPPFKPGQVVFNYGSSKPVLLPNMINPPAAVELSVNKINTYRVLKANLIPTVSFVLNEKDVPQTWNWVVCRSTVTGRNCEGVLITRPYDLLKDCPLYTKYFTHTDEYRIVVYKNNVIARYRKANLNEGQYELELMTHGGFEEVDEPCIQAARAIGLDYCGVDVLCNERTGNYLVLELNSGPLLTDETEAALVKLIKG